MPFQRLFRCQNTVSVAELQRFKVDQNPIHDSLTVIFAVFAPNQYGVIIREKVYCLFRTSFPEIST